MNKLKALLLSLVLCAGAYGRDVVSGACESGAQHVSTQGVQSSTYVQRSYPSCSIVVYLAGTLTKATLFSTFSGTALANPFTADFTGYWFFWADNGQYDVVLYGGQIASPLTRYASVGAATAGSLLAANNLSDVQSVSTSRTNLGLGGAAILNVGTASSTVAAGDDSRFPTAGQKLALAGSSGTPGSGNTYITQNDVSATSSACVIPRADGSGHLAAGFLGNSITSLTGDAVATGPGAAAVVIARAAADGTTVGLASFTAADFNASAGNISLDYTNGQKATGSIPGFLAAADWTTFNNKQPAGTYPTYSGMSSTVGSLVTVSSAGVITASNKYTYTESGGVGFLGLSSTTGILSTFTASNAGAAVLWLMSTGTNPAGYSMGINADGGWHLADYSFSARDVIKVLGGNLSILPSGGNTTITGAVKFASYGAGLLTTDGSGNITATSNTYITNIVGDITGGGSPTFTAGITAGAVITSTIADNNVTLSKMAQVVTASLLGRNTAGTGNVEVLTTLPSAVQDNITRVGTLTTGVVPYSLLTGVPASPVVPQLTCTGTATASATLYLKTSLAVCTNTAQDTSTNVLVQRTGTLRNLRVLAGTAGAAAGSGVITLGKSGSGDTAVTCTVGTGTTCSDTTHSVAVAAGDTVYTKMVTTGGETLANVIVVFEY